MRQEGITSPDPTVQVLIFRDVVRAEGLLCASCFYQLSQAVNCIVRLRRSVKYLAPTQLHFSQYLTPHLSAKLRIKYKNSVLVGRVICLCKIADCSGRPAAG